MTWLLLIIVVVGFVTVACLAFRGKSVGPESTATSNFTPNPGNDKVIFVKGWEQSEIEKIIYDFIEAYKDDGYPAYTIKPHKQSENLYHLTFPEDIHAQLFTFLVNYLAYPFDLDGSNRSIIICAKTTLSPGFEGIDSSLVEKKAILYIPENDQDHDVVYMRTESGVNLANSFSEVKWRRADEPGCRTR